MEIFGGTSVLSRWILTLTESTAPLAGSRRSRGTLPLILTEAGRGIILLTLTELTAPLAGGRRSRGTLLLILTESTAPLAGGVITHR